MLQWTPMFTIYSEHQIKWNHTVRIEKFSNCSCADFQQRAYFTSLESLCGYKLKDKRQIVKGSWILKGE